MTQPGDDLWKRIPPELLRAVVEASPRPLQTYIQFLCLSHTTRAGIRGTLCELTFEVASDLGLSDLIKFTTDALAALLGPCKSLRKLCFPKRWTSDDVTDDTAHDAGEGWVDEAFGGHTQLAVLEQLPPLAEPAIERILGHLPGLVELTVSPLLAMNTRLLAALARSCPRLQVLRSAAKPDQRAGPAQLAALAPLSGVLKELDLRGGEWWDLGVAESLAAFVGGLSAVTSLRLHCYPPAALEPIASRLTALELTGLSDLPGPGFCRLETLALDLLGHYSCSTPLARLLAANQATLCSLTLTLKDSDVLSLVASLRALPHLTHLHLTVLGSGSRALSALLPADLVDRLERLRIRLVDLEPEDPVRIASSHLQRLRIALGMSHPTGLALDCPALVELDMTEAPSCRLTAALQCPRLRVLRLPAAQSLDGAAPMPDLEEADFSWGSLVVDPAWLLAGSPRLRELIKVQLTRPDLLASLCACGSLVRLEWLYLDVTRLPNPLVLKLPGQLERLGLHILAKDERMSEGGLDLQVEAPCLLDLLLAIADPLPAVRLRLHNCPALVRIALKSPATTMLSIQVDEAEDGEAMVPAMQPLCLNFQGSLDAASLLGLLTRHGARLRTLFAEDLLRAASEDWPRLMQALSGLPRLTRLDLEVSDAPSPLSLACPQLRRLVLRRLPGEAKVVLSCPLLERLSGIEDPRRQLVLALPAPRLRCGL
ncbi:hypothetical protein PAPYR_4820 [Paratrimastix pyriformis]|uniref:Uncharacterized protein n=1 Tax=Paratrimastix pyriformis TaxID=342808 RepID=A0ABQ8UJ76_9EUKA|nr:hypothetical protein PAPYR_4820 [Paratrimastix pyriformis]